MLTVSIADQGSRVPLFRVTFGLLGYLVSSRNVANSRPKFLVVLSECFDNYHFQEVVSIAGYNRM